MSYDNIIDQLAIMFPEIDLANYDYLEGLPHCIFDIIFVPYIIKACDTGQVTILTKVGGFLEQMALCSDKRVNELLNVSILEPIVLEEKNKICFLQSYLGEKTSENLKYWLHRYSKI